MRRYHGDLLDKGLVLEKVHTEQVAQADSAECHAACGEDGQASCHPAAPPLSHTVRQPRETQDQRRGDNEEVL